jgi:hypothetical protein
MVVAEETVTEPKDSSVPPRVRLARIAERQAWLILILLARARVLIQRLILGLFQRMQVCFASSVTG